MDDDKTKDIDKEELTPSVSDDDAMTIDASD